MWNGRASSNRGGSDRFQECQMPACLYRGYWFGLSPRYVLPALCCSKARSGAGHGECTASAAQPALFQRVSFARPHGASPRGGERDFDLVPSAALVGRRLEREQISVGKVARDAVEDVEDFGWFVDSEGEAASGFRDAGQLIEQTGGAQRGALRDGVDGRGGLSGARDGGFGGQNALVVAAVGEHHDGLLSGTAGQVAVHAHQGVVQGSGALRTGAEDVWVGGQLVV